MTRWDLGDLAMVLFASCLPIISLGLIVYLIVGELMGCAR